MVAERRTTTTLEVQSLKGIGLVDKVVRAVHLGQPVVTQLWNNYGYLANAANQNAIDFILHAKQDETSDRPFSAMLPTEVFCGAIDLQLVPKELHQILQNPTELEQTLGLICHLRAPITPEAASQFPSRLLSYKDGIAYVQNFFVAGHPELVEIRDRLFAMGDYFAVTTLNEHGHPEITERKDAIQEARKVGVSLLLTDEPKRKEVKGSWAIINVADMTAARDGCVPIETIAQLLKMRISKEGIAGTTHTQDQAFLAFLKSIEEYNVDPLTLRKIIITYLSGADANYALQLAL